MIDINFRNDFCAYSMSLSMTLLASHTSTHTYWFVYIILTDQHSLYTGITTNLQRRFQQHQDMANGIAKSKGAKFFRTAFPQKIVFSEKFNSRSEASRREAEIKAMTAGEKHQLIQ